MPIFLNWDFHRLKMDEKAIKNHNTLIWEQVCKLAAFGKQKWDLKCKHRLNVDSLYAN